MKRKINLPVDSGVRPNRLPIARGKLSIFLIFALATVLYLCAKAKDTPSSSEKLAATMQHFIADQTIAGAVMLVADKDKILSLETIGYSDLDTKKPMQSNDLFWIASMSKSITVTALMMLVDEGKVNVDDPVEKYLPEFRKLEVKDANGKLHPPAHPVRVREMLTHTSGLPKLSAPEMTTRKLDTLPLAQAVATYAETPLKFEPGTSYSYSNAGINTIGEIIEVVSGIPYEQFLQRNIFDPLGMTNTTFWPKPQQTIAKSYAEHPTALKLTYEPSINLTLPLNDRVHRFPFPAGGLFSTATDLAKFCQMYLNNGTVNGKQYLTSESIRAMTKRQTPPTVSVAYGFGWLVGFRPIETGGKASIGGRDADANGQEPYSHGGAFATYMGVDPKRGIVNVLMVQIAGNLTEEGKQVLSTFLKAAHALVGKPAPSDQ